MRDKRPAARQILSLTALLAGFSAVVAYANDPETPPGPAFSCASVDDTRIEHMICTDATLAALDRKLGSVYAQARVLSNTGSALKVEQRGWIKGRNECWKDEDETACIASAYRLRIAELQARYHLVAATGPIRFTCGGDTGNRTMVVTFFTDTDPPTLLARRGQDISLMFLQPSASGAKYAGRNESFWEHHGEARVTWGYGAPEISCRKLP
ncbi:MAG: MliC family protein [Gammaproteobacteria bacterium]|nr:MliC family protein [Gammaproteobacteria bacterium]MCB1924334.1 MliC family protein [Gammaproteobacteria bacterium]